jgi:hypothetical protein
MAGSPQWKVYDSENKYQAACKEIKAAGELVLFYGPGATIRVGRTKREIVWRTGREHDGELGRTHSYADLIDVVNQRLDVLAQHDREKSNKERREREEAAHLRKERYAPSLAAIARMNAAPKSVKKWYEA